MRPDLEVSEAWIIVREDGRTEPTPIAGVAVGYDEAGVLVVENVAVDRLAPAERKRIAAELRRLAREISPADVN